MTSAKWHLASEPPNNCSDVLVRWSSGAVWCAWWSCAGNTWAQRGGSFVGYITHWRELPKFVDPEAKVTKVKRRRKQSSKKGAK